MSSSLEVEESDEGFSGVFPVGRDRLMLKGPVAEVVAEHIVCSRSFQVNSSTGFIDIVLHIITIGSIGH
ncbi:hypothetical protein GBA52_022206 [Prunus armeniaca]|nr:hypothetical protein GBA52_022206 [Prunus armeniaca]